MIVCETATVDLVTGRSAGPGHCWKGGPRMPYVKTSLRGEQRALREEMRALGLSHRQIAVEFARRYQLRPRAAWRHAWGWSLAEAAERISSYAGRAGPDPDTRAVITPRTSASTRTGPAPPPALIRPGAGPPPTGC